MISNKEKFYRIAVLTSGHSRGSNFVAIYNWLQKEKLPVKIVFVTVSNLQAQIIEKCQELGVKYLHLPTKDMTQFEYELLNFLDAYQVDLIALAGFLKKLSPLFIHQFDKPILNIHPALLPKYGGKGMYGISVHQKVFHNKEKESGATVHLVDENYDAGKIISQTKIDITDCTSPEEIAQRVLKIEHKIYGPAIWKVFQDITGY